MSRAPVEPCGIAVFARAPVAGEAKTRLVPFLGKEGAASLHAALVRRTLRNAVAAKIAKDEIVKDEIGQGEIKIGEVTLWCSPDATHPFFHSCRAEFGIGLREQAPGDLGERMLAAFAARRGDLLLIGTDCPILTPGLLRRCAAQLRAGFDAVFLPAEDGGYGLVGLGRPIPALFEGVAWSSASVMEETRARLRAHKLAWSEPAIIWDVDRPQDVERLVASGLLPQWRKPDAVALPFSRISPRRGE
ncbi:MAG: TIGR04282 family arsenosugar biosynthesis glycosyltransferase [Hyphomicrobiales bacterium]